MSPAVSEKPTVSWQLWSNDYFDRDSRPCLELEGQGLVAGCAALWQKVLEEGIMDDGRPTFIGFMLQSQQGQFIVPRDPLMNMELARLRMWRDCAKLIDLLAVVTAASPERIGSLLADAMASSTAEELCRRLQQNDIPLQDSTRQEAGCLCDICGTGSVVFVREDPPGFQLFRCSNCHEIKRWCPRCGQGWLAHFVVDEAPHSRYICDECRTVWDSRWNCLTPEGVPYVASEVMGSNPVLVRDIEEFQ